MSAKELNRDIKRLEGRYNELKAVGGDAYYNEIESLKSELKRLHGADNGAEYMNLSSLKAMIRLNRILQIIPQHQFFINL